MKPNKAIVKQIISYNKKLYVKWNVEYKFFEIWHKCLKGDYRVTPVNQNIYTKEGTGDPFKYEKLDRRILDWLYGADTNKHTKRWKWLGRKNFDQREARKKELRMNMWKNMAKESYNMVNNEFINPIAGEVSNWVAPDMNSRSRYSARSPENSKQFWESQRDPY